MKIGQTTIPRLRTVREALTNIAISFRSEKNEIMLTQFYISTKKFIFILNYQIISTVNYTLPVWHGLKSGNRYIRQAPNFRSTLICPIQMLYCNTVFFIATCISLMPSNSFHVWMKNSNLYRVSDKVCDTIYRKC